MSQNQEATKKEVSFDQAVTKLKNIAANQDFRKELGGAEGIREALGILRGILTGGAPEGPALVLADEGQQEAMYEAEKAEAVAEMVAADADTTPTPTTETLATPATPSSPAPTKTPPTKPIMDKEAKILFDKFRNVLDKLDISWEDVTRKAYEEDRANDPNFQMTVADLSTIIGIDLTMVYGVDHTTPATAKCAICNKEVSNTFRRIIRKDTEGFLYFKRDRGGEIEIGSFVAKRQPDGKFVVDATCSNRVHEDEVSENGKFQCRSYRQVKSFADMKNKEKTEEANLIAKYQEKYKPVVGDRDTRPQQGHNRQSGGRRKGH